MLSKAKVKYIRSLERKKQRQRYDKFVAEGTKIIDEMLLHPNINIEMLVGSTEWLAIHQKRLGKTPVFEASQQDLKQLTFLKTSPQVMVVASTIEVKIDTNTIENDISLFLDGIQDPGNLGTILRIADWFGIEHVFLGEGTVDLYNPKVIQSSMGAFLRVNCVEKPFNSIIESYPDVSIMGADMKGTSVFDLKKDQKKGIIVIGNEGKGISEEIRAKINSWITIPSNGGAESLNAGVAAGIICAALRN